MSAKSVGIAGLMALAGLALFAVIAANPFTTQAATDDSADSQSMQERLSADVITPSQIAGPDQPVQPQAADEDSEDSEPYIGVAIIGLDDGSVQVVRVLEGGPSDGALISGDLITGVDGTTITGTNDLIDAIVEPGSDTTITLTITRDGSSQTVDVTVGERDTTVPSVRVHRSSNTYAPFKSRQPRFGKGKSDAGGEVVHRRIVFENSDGSYSTYRAVIGTVSNVDATAGTFTLSPKDGSDSIDYTISDDTKVSMNRSGDLGPLSTEVDTRVVDVDGEVTLVQQGEWSKRHRGLFRGGRRAGAGGKGMRGARDHFEDRNTMIEKAFEILQSRASDRM